MTVLDGQALVLNRSWLPIGVASVRQALTLMCKGSARAVDAETYRLHDFDSWAELSAAESEEHVATVTLRVPVPEVIVLSGFDGNPGVAVVFSRRNLYRRDRYTCQYCGGQPGIEGLTIDHVVPRADGGASTWENCVLACQACNFRKANRTPRQAGMRLRRQPAKPAWSPFVSIPIGKRRLSWARFVSEAYWNAPLEP
jgi:5-methylcytosine-specific restriction endonuclease McrA